jgi:tRNA-Thr(GGU) m(6)t(6)A37 methyltransferase TsaA
LNQKQHENTVTLTPIGIIRSPFREKFGIPRQPRLIPSAPAQLELLTPYQREEAFSGLEQCSHLWLIFIFHANMGSSWRPMVRPPRLGGRTKVGVFASRAPHRPNPIGISAVNYQGLIKTRHGLALSLTGVDLLDGTPILDIKPYVPYADCITDAHHGFAVIPPRSSAWSVHFAASAQTMLSRLESTERDQIQRLITQMIQQDPRPGYLELNEQRRHFVLHIYDYEVRWTIRDFDAYVTSIELMAQ